MKFLQDTFVLFGRSMRHITRNPDTILTIIIVPVMMMMLFVFVFGGAIQTDADNYINYLLPGILLMAIASGVSYTSLNLFSDIQTGLFARFYSMPVSRSSVLFGHVLTSLASNMASVAVIVIIAVIMGFRSNAGILEWLIVIGMLVLFTLTLSWIAVIAGLTAKTATGANAASYPFVFLPFISSAFVPTATMPTAVRVFAENQPVTSIVNTVRSLLNSETVGNEIWIAITWCVCIMIIAFLFAMRAYKKHSFGS